MTITSQTLLAADSPAALNVLVAAAIAAGKQPIGAPFVWNSPTADQLCQAVVEGAQVMDQVDASIDADDTFAANSDLVAPSQKAVKTALDGLLNTLTIRAAAGVPTGAPTGTEAPVAFDSTESTGGIYLWTGAAWVKGATIP